MAGYERKEVVSLTNVPLRTLDRWKSSPNFSKLLKQGVRKTSDTAIAELVSGAIGWCWGEGGSGGECGGALVKLRGEDLGVRSQKRY